MKDNRPVFLNLFQIKMPITAVVSFMHRVSGVVIFLAIPWLLYLLQWALASQAGFNSWHVWMGHIWFPVCMWLVLVAFGHHLFAGVRHIVMDIGFGETFQAAVISSYLVLLADIFWMIWMGVWIWC